MSGIKSYRDLVAWQKAMDLVTSVYQVSERFPGHERFGLVSQIRRAAVSVPSNIAEGHGRRTKSDFVHFLDVARGSANEVQTQLLIAERLGYVGQEASSVCVGLADEVQRIVNALIRAVEGSAKDSVRSRCRQS
jgi:four helix bundle protein